jgi:hypothetical protein
MPVMELHEFEEGKQKINNSVKQILVIQYLWNNNHTLDNPEVQEIRLPNFYKFSMITK